MHCNEFLGRYSDYDDSLLSSDEERAFRGHLEVCDSCRRYDRVLRKGRMLARQVAGPEPSPDFLPRLQTRLQGLRTGHRARTPRLPAALAAVTVLLVAAAGVTMLRTGVGTGSPGVEEAQAAPAALMDPAGDDRAPVVSSGGRVVALPPAVRVDPADWTMPRVDPRRVSSYSPLVTGPPAFRATRARPYRAMNSTRRALD